MVRPERVIIKFADELTGTHPAFAVVGLLRLENGRDVEVSMQDIDEEELNKLAGQFNLSSAIVIESLAAQVKDANERIAMLQKLLLKESEQQL